jgi:hypothetical protein
LLSFLLFNVHIRNFCFAYFIHECCLSFLTYITVEYVAHVKSTARPMTTEELAAAGLPAEPEIQDHEIAQPLEDHTSPAASRSGIREDGEIRSEEEEIENVDADVKDLIAAKQSGPLPLSFVFGESKVTTNLIREYEAVGFFSRRHWTRSTRRTSSYSRSGRSCRILHLLHLRTEVPLRFRLSRDSGHIFS